MGREREIAQGIETDEQAHRVKEHDDRKIRFFISAVIPGNFAFARVQSLRKKLPSSSSRKTRNHRGRNARKLLRARSVFSPARSTHTVLSTSKRIATRTIGWARRRVGGGQRRIFKQQTGCNASATLTRVRSAVFIKPSKMFAWLDVKAPLGSAACVLPPIFVAPASSLPPVCARSLVMYVPHAHERACSVNAENAGSIFPHC